MIETHNETGNVAVDRKIQVQYVTTGFDFYCNVCKNEKVKEFKAPRPKTYVKLYDSDDEDLDDEEKGKIVWMEREVNEAKVDHESDCLVDKNENEMLIKRLDAWMNRLIRNLVAQLKTSLFK